MKNLTARDPGDQSSFPYSAEMLGHSLHLGLCLSSHPLGEGTLQWLGPLATLGTTHPKPH